MKKDSTVTVKAEEKAEVKQKCDCGFSAYIGPTIVGYIQKDTLFPCPKKEALERPEVKRAIDYRPSIKPLFVPGDELASAREKVKIKGEALCKAYKAALIK